MGRTVPCFCMLLEGIIEELSAFRRALRFTLDRNNVQPEKNMLPISATVRAPGAGLSPQPAATMTARQQPCRSERRKR